MSALTIHSLDCLPENENEVSGSSCDASGTPAHPERRRQGQLKPGSFPLLLLLHTYELAKASCSRLLRCRAALPLAALQDPLLERRIAPIANLPVSLVAESAPILDMPGRASADSDPLVVTLGSRSLPCSISNLWSPFARTKVPVGLLDSVGEASLAKPSARPGCFSCPWRRSGSRSAIFRKLSSNAEPCKGFGARAGYLDAPERKVSQSGKLRVDEPRDLLILPGPSSLLHRPLELQLVSKAPKIRPKIFRVLRFRTPNLSLSVSLRYVTVGCSGQRARLQRFPFICDSWIPDRYQRGLPPVTAGHGQRPLIWRRAKCGLK
eukprot:scaffold1724_cov246-Pinguiococcus_pyrenoidosus.AAC.23